MRPCGCQVVLPRARIEWPFDVTIAQQSRHYQRDMRRFNPGPTLSCSILPNTAVAGDIEERCPDRADRLPPPRYMYSQKHPVLLAPKTPKTSSSCQVLPRILVRNMAQ